MVTSRPGVYASSGLYVRMLLVEESGAVFQGPIYQCLIVQTGVLVLVNSRCAVSERCKAQWKTSNRPSPPALACKHRHGHRNKICSIHYQFLTIACRFRGAAEICLLACRLI